MNTRVAWLLLAVIFTAAAWLRLARPGTSPPGMNVDEAENAWNSYCLLKTGMDQHGVRFPIFRARMFGYIDNRSTLFLYFAMPFLAWRGLGIESIRMAGAVAGLLSILLTYYIGSRLFGRATGLVAATLLTLNPWHLQQTRWGHEASLTPLLVTLPLAALLWAGFPLTDDSRRASLWRSLIAGVLCGICCYGYPAVRIFLPLLIAATMAVNWRAWWACDKRALAALALGFFALYGPLAWKQLTDPEMSARANQLWAWGRNDSAIEKVFRVIARYPPHFGADFLFFRGDANPWYTPPEGYGTLLWYTLPMMLAGIGAVILAWKRSRAARFLALWVVLYPAGDLLNYHPGPNAMRSLPGVCALMLLAAWGTTKSVAWIAGKAKPAGWIFGGTIAMAVLAMNIFFLDDFFGPFNRQASVWPSFNVDLVRALEWLRPRYGQIDTVFCTAGDLPHPYAYAMVELNYDPKEWFRGPIEKIAGPAPNRAHPGEDVYVRVGKLFFFYGMSDNERVRAASNNGRAHIVFIVRPGEINGLGKPAFEIQNEQGKVTLQVFDAMM